MLNVQSKLQISLVQLNALNLMGAPSSLFEPDHLFHAGNKPQCSSVHSMCTRNMKVIHASLGRSNLNFDEGVERCALDDICVHTEEADPLITQVSSRDLCETSIQRISKQDLGYLTRIIELKLVPASSYDLSAIGSIMKTSRIENPSCFKVLGSGFSLDVNDMQQAPDLALMDEAFDEPWMIC